MFVIILIPCSEVGTSTYVVDDSFFEYIVGCLSTFKYLALSIGAWFRIPNLLTAARASDEFTRSLLQRLTHCSAFFSYLGLKQ